MLRYSTIRLGLFFSLKIHKVNILYFSIPFLIFGQQIYLTKSVLSRLFHWKSRNLVGAQTHLDNLQVVQVGLGPLCFSQQ